MHFGLHHAEKRKKEGNAKLFDHIMIGIGLVAPLALIPQVLTVWANKDVSSISLVSWLLLSGVSFMWMIYGSVRRSPALFISNVLVTVLNVLMVIAVLLFR